MVICPFHYRLFFGSYLHAIEPKKLKNRPAILDNRSYKRQNDRIIFYVSLSAKHRRQNDIKTRKSQKQNSRFTGDVKISKPKSAQSRDGRLCRRETWIGSKFDFRLPSPRRKRQVLKFPNNSSEGGEEVRSQSDTPAMKRCQSEASHPTPDVDLEDLTEDQTEDQKIAVATILREEAESFSKDDDDVGCAEGLQLKINLSDNRPVQKNYTSIPKPLYSEVKQYVEDLLNRRWVRKSRSAYSSPVVCVRKRDGSLRLCVDFRELNRRTVPDRHPLPRVHTTIENLGGNKWFSLLDQGKAYYQGFVNPECQHMTTFVHRGACTSG